jgi:uncharacterized protein (TIGR02284 family)
MAPDPIHTPDTAGHSLRDPDGLAPFAERVDHAAEDAYWSGRYQREPYYRAGLAYDDYRPAYELGWSNRSVREHDFDTLEPGIAAEWGSRRGSSQLDWNEARIAARAAWDRADATYFPHDEGQVIAVLNDLLENARDGEYGFHACAEQVGNAHLQQVLNEHAIACRRAGEELMQWIVQRGGRPADGGTTAGALHRGWVSLKGAFGANSEVSILEECERGEDAALARYRKALRDDALPADVRGMLERQMEGTQRDHDQVRQLRDQAKAVA